MLATATASTIAGVSKITAAVIGDSEWFSLSLSLVCVCVFSVSVVAKVPSVFPDKNNDSIDLLFTLFDGRLLHNQVSRALCFIAADKRSSITAIICYMSVHIGSVVVVMVTVTAFPVAR